jgi:hypothetical protein
LQLLPAEEMQMNHRSLTGLVLMAVVAIAATLFAPAATISKQALAGRYPLRARTSDFYSRAKPDGLSAQKTISKRTPVTSASR